MTLTLELLNSAGFYYAKFQVAIIIV